MNSRNRQRGFLAIVAIAVVVIVAFIAVTATYQYAGDSLSSTNQLRSAQAFQIAQAGIEQAKYDIVTTGSSCSGYTSGTVSFTPPSGSGSGQYLVTGTTNSASSTLNGTISNSSNTITVTNAAGFSAPQGAAYIDSELISYSGISGNTLTGVARGINGTTASAHSSGAAIQQTQCFLTSTAGIPTIASPDGRRILKALLIRSSTGFAFNINGNLTLSTLVAGLSSDIQGNGTVRNNEVTSSSSNYPGSNILYIGSSQIQGSAQTQINNGSGTPINNSTSSSSKPDIRSGAGLYTSATLWNHYFSASQSTVQSNMTQYSSSSAINGLQGQAIWFNGDLTFNGNRTLGSPTSPVLLIVDGNFHLNGNANVYGFIFVLGSFETQGNATLTGGLAATDSVQVQGNAIVSLDSSIINYASNLSNLTTNGYSKNAVTLQEVFP